MGYLFDEVGLHVTVGLLTVGQLCVGRLVVHIVVSMRLYHFVIHDGLRRLVAAQRTFAQNIEQIPVRVVMVVGGAAIRRVEHSFSQGGRLRTKTTVLLSTVLVTFRSTGPCSFHCV